MRIVLITDHHTSLGGTENYFFDLKTRLKTLPDSEVYSMGFGPETIEENDVFVLKAPRSNLAKLFWRLVLHPSVYVKLRRWLKKIQPDIIHIHNVKRYSSAVLQAIKSYPVVQTVHDFSVICPIAQNIHKNSQVCATGLTPRCFWQHQIKFNWLTYLLLTIVFYRIVNRLKKVVNYFISPSPILTDYLVKNQFHNVTTILPFKKEQHGYSFEKVKSNQFLFAGNLGTHKGVYILLEEFAVACQKNKDLTLLIAGSGPEEKAMQAKVSALGLQKQIHFLGWQNDLSPVYEASTAIIFPSIGMESFGLVMTESMSHARCIIGAKRGTTAWLVDDQQTGLLFDPLKSGDLAEKILTLAEDTDLAKKLGRNGYEKLQQLIHNDEALQQIMQIYKKCMTGFRGKKSFPK